MSDAAERRCSGFRWGWVALSVLLAACPRPARDGNPDGGALTFEVGSLDVEGTFSALGEDLYSERGNQGGVHVSIVYRLPEGGAGDITFALAVRRAADGELLAESSRSYDVGFAAPGWRSPEPIQVVLCPTRSAVTIARAALDFEVTATGSTTPGELGRAVATATFQCPASFSGCDSYCAR